MSNQLSEGERLVLQRALEIVAGIGRDGAGERSGEQSSHRGTPASASATPGGGGGGGDQETTPRTSSSQENPSVGDDSARAGASRNLRTPRSAALELSSPSECMLLFMS